MSRLAISLPQGFEYLNNSLTQTQLIKLIIIAQKNLF